jgi:hypothetical protein
MRLLTKVAESGHPARPILPLTRSVLRSSSGWPSVANRPIHALDPFLDVPENEHCFTLGARHDTQFLPLPMIKKKRTLTHPCSGARHSFAHHALAFAGMLLTRVYGRHRRVRHADPTASRTPSVATCCGKVQRLRRAGLIPIASTPHIVFSLAIAGPIG